MLMIPDSPRQSIPNGRLRAPWHDYRSRCIYMITINKAPEIPRFSTIAGEINNHYNPPHTDLSPIGEVISKCISDIKTLYPFTGIKRRVVMPDHIHFVIFVYEKTNHHLGKIINYFKTICSQRCLPLLSQTTLQPIFESGYHDRILLHQNQLASMLNYVSQNPRRRLQRIKFPSFHSYHKIISPDGIIFEVYGNIHLIEEPDISAVKIRRHWLRDDFKPHLNKIKRRWLQTIQNGGVLASPFISAEEKKVRDWALHNGGRVILIQENGFRPRFAPSGHLHEICTQGRLLIIAFSDYNPRMKRVNRSQCEAMNALAARIANHEFIAFNP